MGISSIKNVSTGSTIGLWHMTESWQQLAALVNLQPSQLAPLDEKKTDKRKQEWLACRILLQEMTHHPPIIDHDINRKPHLKNSNFELSMSHSGSYAAVYIDPNKPVGIDIQQMKPDISKGSDYFLNALEQVWADLTDIRLLHLIWSAKESVFKYAGDAELDLKKHIITKPFHSNQKGKIEVSILKDGLIKKITVGFETFDDYVLTWTL